MINFFKNANEDKKEFKVSRIKKMSTKNGNPYTLFQIADSVKDSSGKRVYDNWTCWVWKDLEINEGDKIVIDKISAIKDETVEINGKPYFNKTLFCSVTITESAQPNKVEVVGELQPLDNFEGELSF